MRSASVTASAGAADKHAARARAVAHQPPEVLTCSHGVRLYRFSALFKEVMRYQPFAAVSVPQFRAGHEEHAPVHPPARAWARRRCAPDRHEFGPMRSSSSCSRASRWSAQRPCRYGERRRSRANQAAWRRDRRARTVAWRRVSKVNASAESSVTGKRGAFARQLAEPQQRDDEDQLQWRE